jgi:hypothetical protein
MVGPRRRGGGELVMEDRGYEEVIKGWMVLDGVEGRCEDLRGIGIGVA